MIINVLLADGHGVLRDALRSLLESESDLRVVGAARTGQEALREARRLAPQVVLMEAALPATGGIEAAQAIIESQPQAGVVFLSAQDSSDVIHRAVEAGARGYLTKDCSGAEVVKAIRAVAAGKRYFGKGIADKVFDNLSGAPRRAGLE